MSQPRPVYVHSKLLLVDDTHLCTGSANFASRALRIDTETVLTLHARSEAERRHLRELRARILSHWGVAGAEPGPESEFLRFHPFVPKRGARPRGHFLARLYDPVLPIGYRQKRWLITRARRWPTLTAITVLALSTSLGALALSASGAPPGWGLFYATLLAFSWLVPVPFATSALNAAWILGAEAGAALAALCLWQSAVLGYFWARFFPDSATRIVGPPRARSSARLGQRTFESTLRSVMDPTVPLCSRMVDQGIYCTPIPWFAMGSLLLLPSCAWTLCYWSARLAPAGWLAALRAHPSLPALLLLAWTAASGIRSVRSTRARRLKPESSSTPQEKLPHAA